MSEPMTDERLAQIETVLDKAAFVYADDGRNVRAGAAEMAAEIRRLRSENAHLAEQRDSWRKLAEADGRAVGMRYD